MSEASELAKSMPSSEILTPELLTRCGKRDIEPDDGKFQLWFEVETGPDPRVVVRLAQPINCLRLDPDDADRLGGALIAAAERTRKLSLPVKMPLTPLG